MVKKWKIPGRGNNMSKEKRENGGATELEKVKNKI